MNVLRTVTFKLRLTSQDKESLLNTMRAYAEAFSISAKWGFENRSWNKVENHKATYKLTRQGIPDLPSLSKIRVQKRRGKEFDRKLNSWPLYQLEQFIRYKAEALGKHVLLVDANSYKLKYGMK